MFIAISTTIAVALFLVWAVRRSISRANLNQYYEDQRAAAHTRDNPTVAFHVRKGDGTTRNVTTYRS